MIRPLTGQALVEMLPADSQSSGGVVIPEKAREKAIKGVVRAMGHWPKGKNGIHHLPEFHVGQTVIIGRHTGIQMHRNIGERFKMVKVRDVLAVVDVP